MIDAFALTPCDLLRYYFGKEIVDELKNCECMKKTNFKDLITNTNVLNA